MKTLLFTLFLLFSITLKAEVEVDKYTLQGYAYTKDSLPIVNDTLTFFIQGKERKMVTDKNGFYTTEVIWTFGECMNRGSDNAERDEKMNPDIKIRYKNNTVLIANQWKEARIASETDKRYVDQQNLRF